MLCFNDGCPTEEDLLRHETKKECYDITECPEDAQFHDMTDNMCRTKCPDERPVVFYTGRDHVC